MLDIGWSEFFVIGVIALVVIGPARAAGCIAFAWPNYFARPEPRPRFPRWA